MFNVSCLMFHVNLQSAFSNLSHETVNSGFFVAPFSLFTLIKTDFTCKYRYFFVTLCPKRKKSATKGSFFTRESKFITHFYKYN
jgi:hypothetical protein